MRAASQTPYKTEAPALTSHLSLTLGLAIMGVSEPTYPLFPTFAFLGFVVGLIPLRWHLQGWNAGTCIYMLWVSLASLVEFVDSIVWNGSIDNSAPVWCDICRCFLHSAGGQAD